jgi:deoxyribodipyrimidine photolyase-related protein
VQEKKNHFNHHKKLSPLWYSGNTGIPPLDDVIEKVKKYSYSHHIERLMVVGSLMVLLEVDPKEAHKWFMEMYIDSSDWVMGPNVYGMALFSDGGLFATKPYICGSNYYRKMSGYKAGEWCDGVDGLYWMFIEKNKDTFAKNPRMSMMVRTFEKIPEEKLKRLRIAANQLRARLVV